MRRSLCLDEGYGSHDWRSAYDQIMQAKRQTAIEENLLGARPQLRGDCANDVPAGLVVGCRKVKELVPKVRLARFHRESLP